MKVNWIFVLISLGIAALVGYGFHAGTANLFLTLGGGFVLFATFAGTLAVSFGRGSKKATAHWLRLVRFFLWAKGAENVV